MTCVIEGDPDSVANKWDWKNILTNGNIGRSANCRRGAFAEVFSDKIEKIPECGCHVWTGAIRHDTGYGVVIVGGKQYKAHRASYISAFGPIHDGLLVCHRCDNRLCVNPQHLFLGTNKDNLRDMSEKGRSCRGERQAAHKLTEMAVKWIRENLGKLSQHQMAKQLGVSVSAVNLVALGRTWGHV